MDNEKILVRETESQHGHGRLQSFEHRRAQAVLAAVVPGQPPGHEKCRGKHPQNGDQAEHAGVPQQRGQRGVADAHARITLLRQRSRKVRCRPRVRARRPGHAPGAYGRGSALTCSRAQKVSAVPRLSSAVLPLPLLDRGRLALDDVFHEFGPVLNSARRIREHQRRHQHRKHASHADASQRRTWRASRQMSRAEHHHEHQQQVQHGDLRLVDQQRAEQQQRSRNALSVDSPPFFHSASNRRSTITCTRPARRWHRRPATSHRTCRQSMSTGTMPLPSPYAFRHQKQVLVRGERQLQQRDQQQTPQQVLRERPVPAQERDAEEQAPHLEVVLAAQQGDVQVAEVDQQGNDTRSGERERPYDRAGQRFVRVPRRRAH